MPQKLLQIAWTDENQRSSSPLDVELLNKFDETTNTMVENALVWTSGDQEITENTNEYKMKLVCASIQGITRGVLEVLRTLLAEKCERTISEIMGKSKEMEDVYSFT